MAVNDLIECRIVCTRGDQTSINVRHYLVTAETGLGAPLLTMAQNRDLAWATFWKNVLGNGAAYRGVGMRKIQPLPPSTEQFTIASLGPGVVTGDMAPTQVSGVVTLRTDFAGRRYRGRTFVGFPSESDSDGNGIPTTAYISRLDSLANELDNGFVAVSGPNTSTLVAVVYSKKFGLRTPITGHTTQPRWGTIRSRGSYGRVNFPPF